MTMNPKLIFFPIIMLLFIGCDSSNSSTNSSDCLFLNESLGCDGNCSTTPLEDDACGVCGGENTILSECDLPHCESDVCISIQNVDLINNILEVWMLNNIPVAGYQFNISGITNISASGGSAQSNGMSPTIGENIILGFSFSGDAIPPGNGVFTQLAFSESSGSICLSLPVFSNNSGEALSVELGECF
jgi:hypothetical protein